MNLLRLAVLLLALPGRLLIRTIDGLKRSNGVPPLGPFLRGCVHGFLGLFALMAFSMATLPPAPAPTFTYVAPRYTPPPRPVVLPTSAAPTSTAPSTAVEEPAYVPLPDDEDDGESRFCRRRWWC